MLVQSSYQFCKKLLVLLQSVVTMASLDQIVAETLSPISKVRNNGEYVESASRIKSNQIKLVSESSSSLSSFNHAFRKKEGA